MSSQNEYGQGKSHTTGDSIVPEKAQEVLPQGVEESVPNKLHDTGSSGAKSHATGQSYVPEALQQVVPEKVERAIPNAIHDTGNKKVYVLPSVLVRCSVPVDAGADWAASGSNKFVID